MLNDDLELASVFPHSGWRHPLRHGYACCYVCGTRLRQDYKSVSEGVLHKEQESCPNGCYDYEYAYGSHRTYINIRGHHIDFQGSYTDTSQESLDRSNTMDVVIAAAQACLLEDFWAKFPRLGCFQCGNPSTVHFCSDRCARKGTTSPWVQSDGRASA